MNHMRSRMENHICATVKLEFGRRKKRNWLISMYCHFVYWPPCVVVVR